MPRIDLYRNVHMGQRARLFSLAVELGAADVAEPGSAANLADRCLAMTRELREHADHEDSYIHPLLRDRAPEAADALDVEHARLDAALDALDDRARGLPNVAPEALPEAQHDLYLALNALISTYLAHLHVEETIAMPTLWERCGDDELRAVFDAFHASRGPEDGITDLRGMLPSLPPATRTAILRVTLGATPPDEARRILDAVSTALSPSQRTRLHDDLKPPQPDSAGRSHDQRPPDAPNVDEEPSRR